MTAMRLLQHDTEPVEPGSSGRCSQYRPLPFAHASPLPMGIELEGEWPVC